MSKTDLVMIYDRAGELRHALQTAEWSRGMTQRDHRTIAQLTTKALALEKLVYRTMHPGTPIVTP